MQFLKGYFIILEMSNCNVDTCHQAYNECHPYSKLSSPTTTTFIYTILCSNSNHVQRRLTTIPNEIPSHGTWGFRR